jgi:hypothetical protein
MWQATCASHAVLASHLDPIRYSTFVEIFDSVHPKL